MLIIILLFPIKRFLLIILLLLLSRSSSFATDQSFGDSVTYYIAATDQAHGYVSLLSVAEGHSPPIINNGQSGAMVPDMANYVYNASLLPSDRPTIMLGINDERIYCPSPCTSIDPTKLGYYRVGLEAEVAYLSLGSKQIAQGSGVETGSWSNTSLSGNIIGRSSNTNGSTDTFTVSGTVVYIGMIQADSTPGTFNILIDGSQVDSGTTLTVGLGPTSIITQPPVTYGPMLKRYAGLSSGAHTVQIVVTSTTGGSNYVYVDWVSGNSQANYPHVYVGNVLRAVVYSQGGSDSNVAAYNGAVSSLASELTSDGLNVTLVDVSSADYTGCMDGGYHPINCGHAILERIFYFARNPQACH